jgi:predicted ATPase/DNA-binding SARP family transcriptional activator
VTVSWSCRRGWDRRGCGPLIRGAAGRPEAYAGTLPGTPDDAARFGGLRIAILGPISAWVGGVPLALSRHQRVLVAFGASRLDRPMPTDSLIEALWGDRPPHDPAAALRNVLSRFRRALGGSPSPLTGGPGGYRLALPRGAVDAYEFEDLVAAARDRPALEQAPLLEWALRLWRGDAYAEFADRDWAEADARRLDDLRSIVREDRARALLAGGRPRDALPDLEAHLVQQPQREEVRALLMEALSSSGRHTEALHLYEVWRHELAERGLEPSPALRATEALVLRHSTAGPVPLASGSPPVPHPVAFPRPISSFIGREAEVRAVAARLRHGRLVTLVGVGGVGKTRLAVEVANTIRGRYRNGISFCDLSPARTPDDVAAIVSAAVGLREQGSDPVPLQLARHLHDRSWLVVLDNCERVRSATAALAEALTTHTSAVDLLATSRQRLAADGEVIVPVEPLAARDPESPAALLFADRRSAVVPEPADRTEQVVMARICRKLDGLPLAIELAAARSRGVTLPELEQGLDRRFAILVDADRTQSRHRSLDAMITWSHDELRGATDVVFRRLGVFRGGFDSDVAVEVLSETGLSAADVTGGLLDLVDCSLLRWSATSSGSRYSMLDSIRDFAIERLRQSGELDAVAGSHAAWVVRLGEAIGEHLDGPEEATWAGRVSSYLDDVRAAVEWLLAAGDERVLRLVSSLHFYALWRAEWEIFGWAERATEAFAGSSSPFLAGACATAARRSWQRGDLDGARLANDAARRVVSATGPTEMRWPLTIAADLALIRGELDAAVASYRSALDLSRQAVDASQAIWDEGSCALAQAYGGRLDEARAAAESLLALVESAGGPTARAFAHFVLAEIDLDGSPHLAERHLAVAADLAGPVESRYVLALVEVARASMASRAGDVRAALAGYESVLSSWQRTGSRTGLAVTVRSVVTLLARTGDARDAALLYGAATRPRHGGAPYGHDALALAAARTELEAALGADAFAELDRRGRMLDDDELVDQALRAVRSASARDRGGAGRTT